MKKTLKKAFLLDDANDVKTLTYNAIDLLLDRNKKDEEYSPILSLDEFVMMLAGNYKNLDEDSAMDVLNHFQPDSNLDGQSSRFSGAIGAQEIYKRINHHVSLADLADPCKVVTGVNQYRIKHVLRPYYEKVISQNIANMKDKIDEFKSNNCTVFASKWDDDAPTIRYSDRLAQSLPAVDGLAESEFKLWSAVQKELLDGQHVLYGGTKNYFPNNDNYNKFKKFTLMVNDHAFRSSNFVDTIFKYMNLASNFDGLDSKCKHANGFGYLTMNMVCFMIADDDHEVYPVALKVNPILYQETFTGDGPTFLRISEEGGILHVESAEISATNCLTYRELLNRLKVSFDKDLQDKPVIIHDETTGEDYHVAKLNTLKPDDFDKIKGQDSKKLSIDIPFKSLSKKDRPF